MGEGGWFEKCKKRLLKKHIITKRVGGTLEQLVRLLLKGAMQEIARTSWVISAAASVRNY